MSSFVDLKNRVIDKGLCTACGGCVGVCPVNAISFKDKSNECIPYLSGDCIDCGLCDKICIAQGFDINELKDKQLKLSGTPENDSDNQYFITHSSDPLIWKNSASGGFVTTALLYALENDIIDAAVVVTNDPDKPWLPKTVLARTRTEVIAAMQSKYCIVPVLEILKEIAPLNERIGLVLLPCQAQTLVSVQSRQKNKYSNIVLTIGLMCGNALPYKATEDVLSALGIDDLSNIVDLKYRDGLWHGDLHVRMKDGTEKGIPYVEYMRYMADFYRRDRCRMCIDGDAIYTDVSSGDGWIPNKKQDGVYGWSVVHTHSKRGEDLYKSMLDAEALISQTLSEKEAFKMKHMYKRHHSSLPRIEYRRAKNMYTPIYTGFPDQDSVINKNSVSRKQFSDKIQSLMFSPVSRKILSPLPVSIKSSALKLIYK